MREFVNPYIAGNAIARNPVTSAEMFFGREDVFAFVRQALIGKHRDNVIILYGQRRTGKTSAPQQETGSEEEMTARLKRARKGGTIK